jgi:parvulin-like peptidyl-prolyl isomerase
VSSLFGKKEKVQCSHILVQEESQAQALLAELQAGADFASKARELPERES